ncbi:hypothetical protein F5Y14DRAFT_354734 [Nemania sp. NC0429]|nr:hypothetical protein F5Y14DRAFT_354734 [Nemania sp. NC0429]
MPRSSDNLALAPQPSAMSSEDHETCEMLAAWYATTFPRRVDIVGDFGGKQLFLIDGDSILLHSITTSGVDYDVGFQLLHAVFAVESFLRSLQVRGCNFHVVFFDNQGELCLPPTMPASGKYKYQMTRTILIRHLQRHAQDSQGSHAGGMVFSFPSIDSHHFHQHLAQHPATFLLCHDGHTRSGEHMVQQAACQYMIHQFLRLRHSVALISGIEFKSSRVVVPIITVAGKIRSLDQPPNLWPNASLPISEEPLRFDLALYEGTSYRELVTVVALSRALNRQKPDNYTLMAAAMILHSIVITHTRLTERSTAIEGSMRKNAATERVNIFLEHFCQETNSFIKSDLGASMAERLEWDLFDIIDGRLFLSLHTMLLDRKPLPVALFNYAKPLITCVEKWSGVSLSDSLHVSTILQTEPHTKPPISYYDVSQAKILPFNHELLNEFLAPVQLSTTQLHEGVNEHKVFQELTHWHNAKRAIDPKRIPKKPGFFARKRNQKFMADTLVYSASLTNATGKLIKPRTIITGVSARPLKKPVASHTSTGPPKAASSHEPKKNKTRGSSGKESAHETALLTQARKLEKKSSAAFRHWHIMTKEFNQEAVLTKRFLKAVKYFQNLPTEDKAIIGAEVSLYLCDTLYLAWEEQAAKANGQQALGIRSLVFNQVTETLILPGLTQEIAAVLRVLGSAVGIPWNIPPDKATTSHQLSFHPQVNEAKKGILLPMRALDFQLGFCGPFLERTFDSRKDDRVSFEPDAWQRSVLDSIDANDSLFIVAPTSSGKTFISFYAMEAILREDDDGVLVYVAPTKALVNQIAAEIQARFSKNYHHEGRSVWAIHTRDYRVNNPTGCQILVTVPHVLQIMLLSPSHANTWSKRVRRIIFDEVHCIGQADDGIIWEQLLLMAPCPIIALSATVGNSEEFCEWLSVSQQSKGFKLKMIKHNTRYSDLRAFRYVPPEPFEFKGLEHTEHLPVPGLDRSNRADSSFRFIHPIASLVNRTGFDLDELSLEPRDALTLWERMNKFQTRSFPLDNSLNPNQAFLGVPKKSDVLAWTQRLKSVLATWIRDTSSPFDRVRNSLEVGGHANYSPNQTATEASSEPSSTHVRQTPKSERASVFALICELHKDDGLPAILFNYDRVECELLLQFVLEQLDSAEKSWKESSRDWKNDLRDYDRWKVSNDKKKVPKKASEKLTKDEKMRDEANADISRWESFDPEWPLDQFSFADGSRLTRSDLADFIASLDSETIQPHLFSALKRGIAVHHAGMNRRYRQVVEILFRKGYLTVVIATGTLALGINMPCKTVAFIGDSTYLTTLNYRQGAGRAGRRGFDLLGNVVFSNVSRTRAYELMSSRLPDLKGHFPLTTTLILRTLGLLDAAGQSGFTSGIVKSLLTQNRLYLGGEEAGKSIQHHLRFSVEYLQRQHLLSSDGKPINFAGLVGHLYFTENAVFAFHSLLKGGYFHRLCSNIHQGTTDKLRTLCLVMAHLFVRIQARNLDSTLEAYAGSASLVLPPLPKDAEELLIGHNNETLEIFKTYAGTYIDQYLEQVPDRHLPLTGFAVGGEGGRILDLPNALPMTKLRSPFSALSGHSDDFKSIHELCTSIRSGVFLEESAVPYIPIWPHDLPTPLNSFIYDFFKHGDYVAMSRDNKIKQGDVWFLLRDFSLVLATIIASLTNFIQADGNSDDGDMLDIDDVAETPDENIAVQAEKIVHDNTKHVTAARPKPTKKKVAESWDDSDDDSDDTSDEDNTTTAQTRETTPPDADSPTWEKDGKGLVDVLKAFTLLKEEFDEKFHKAWA